MGFFDFLKKKPTETAPEPEEQKEGVAELDGVTVELKQEQEDEVLLQVDEEKEADAAVRSAVHEAMGDEDIQIHRGAEDTLYDEDETAEEQAEEAPEAEIEIELSTEDGEEYTPETEEEGKEFVEALTDLAGEILEEKPLADDEVVVVQEDGAVFTAETEAEEEAFVSELADAVAEEMEQEAEPEPEPEPEPEAEPEPEPEPEPKEQKKGFFARLKEGLDKTRKNILGGVDTVLGSFTKIDEDLFEELEETLIMADLGVQTTMDIVENLRKRVKKEHTTDPSHIKDMLIDEISEILSEGVEEEENLPSPTVMLVIGVNGVGKTTTIGKMAHNFKSEGKTVLLAAADTFRAAAIDQLEVWGERAGIPVIKHEESADPAAVVYDAVHEARNQKTDLLICDTAGRLHNKKNLMAELEKIDRVITREYPAAHKEVYLVLDATTGQNALQQAKLFKETADITGIILTKLDGTAKGGIVVAIKSELKIPVRYIGVGEGISDLQKFDAQDFAKALFGE